MASVLKAHTTSLSVATARRVARRQTGVVASAVPASGDSTGRRAAVLALGTALIAVRPGTSRADEVAAPVAAAPVAAPTTGSVADAYEAMTRTGASTQAALPTDVAALAGGFLGPVVVGVGGFAAYNAFAGGKRDDEKDAAPPPPKEAPKAAPAPAAAAPKAAPVATADAGPAARAVEAQAWIDAWRAKQKAAPIAAPVAQKAPAPAPKAAPAAPAPVPAPAVDDIAAKEAAAAQAKKAAEAAAAAARKAAKDAAAKAAVEAQLKALKNKEEEAKRAAVRDQKLASMTKTMASAEAKAAKKESANPFEALFGAATSAVSSNGKAAQKAAPVAKKAPVAAEAPAGGNPFAALFGGDAEEKSVKKAAVGGTQRRAPVAAVEKSSTRKLTAAPASGSRLRSKSAPAASPAAPVAQTQEEKEEALAAALARLQKAEAKAVEARKALNSQLAIFFKAAFESGVEKADAAVEAAEADVAAARKALEGDVTDLAKRALLILLPLGALLAGAAQLVGGLSTDSAPSTGRRAAPKVSEPAAPKPKAEPKSLTPKVQTLVEDAIKSGNGSSAYEQLIKGK